MGKLRRKGGTGELRGEGGYWGVESWRGKVPWEG